MGRIAGGSLAALACACALGLLSGTTVAHASPCGHGYSGGCLPTSAECAAGTGQGVTLGEHLGSAAVCVGAGGKAVLYAGGNVLIPCGWVTVAGQDLTAGDPNDCDTLLDLPSPDQLEFQVRLPSDYETSGKSYPVLYLLTASTQDEWPVNDPHLQDIADRGVIIVLPARGFGFYVDWESGEHHFETLYSETLVDFVDSHYRTIADRHHRALAGASKAGYGAMLFAARHPDRFAAAASLSGIVNIANPISKTVFWAQLAAGGFGTYDDPAAGFDNPIWGNPLTNSIGWHANDPTDLAINLRGVSLYAASGNGVPTPAELAASGPLAAFGIQQEVDVRRQNDNFDAALTKAGIPHRYVKHGGTHSGIYWVPELHDWAATMMNLFAHPQPDPATFDYRSAASTFAVWDWTFRADPHRAREFLTVQHASRDGVTLTGSGATSVLTTPLFAAGQGVRVTGASGAPALMRADSAGRLSFVADLGRPHTLEQFTLAQQAQAAKGPYFTTRRFVFQAVP